MSLENLPSDIQKEIALKLSPKDLLAFCLANKNLNIKICNSETFWRNKLYKDFPFLAKFKKDEKWKEFYIKMIFYISTVEENTGIPYIINKEYNPKILYDKYKKRGRNFDVYLYALKTSCCGGDKNNIKQILQLFPFGSYINDVFYTYILCGNRELYDFFINEGATHDTAIYAAAASGDLEYVKKLLSKCENFQDCINKILIGGAGAGNKNIVDYAIEQGVENNIIEEAIEDSETFDDIGNGDMTSYLRTKLV